MPSIPLFTSATTGAWPEACGESLGRFLARRTLQLIPVFFGATFLIYAMVFAIPGDPVRALFGDRPVAESTIRQIEEDYNLNDPLLVQYGKYIAGVFQGDLGRDFRGRDVAEIIGDAFPVTLRLAIFAFTFEVILGLIAGLLAGLRRASFMDSLVLVSTTAVISVPVFALGYTAQILFGIQLDLLPIAGLRDGLLSYVLPAAVLGSLGLAYTARLTRTSLVENLRADYVRTATAKGMSRRRVVGRHALRNSLIPVVTFLGTDLGALMAGAVVTEGVFNIPGIGREVFEATRSQENTVVVGIVTVLVIVFMFSNLVVDLLYAYLDPRIRYE
ncbi:MAG: ABC transporter permease [Euzebyaceae bacterium]|nr:ABC transporter permease [Euzebyaceae bacterium]